MSESSSRPPSRSKRSAEEHKSGEPSFESRLEALRRIVDELESGELPLEKAIARYEEGVGVLKSCASTLAEARQRVEELAKDAEGALRLTPARDLEPDDEDEE
ncbi:MAG: exodeoxyribonuclease VII small subunit [Planctomycetes bacterium]|nr:exodeoxyribonuclease VII small subunit [Planctomycetota bacterium]